VCVCACVCVDDLLGTVWSLRVVVKKRVFDKNWGYCAFSELRNNRKDRGNGVFIFIFLIPAQSSFSYWPPVGVFPIFLHRRHYTEPADHSDNRFPITFGHNPVCIAIYIYIYVCVCMCVWESVSWSRHYPHRAYKTINRFNCLYCYCCSLFTINKSLWKWNNTASIARIQVYLLITHTHTHTHTHIYK